MNYRIATLVVVGICIAWREFQLPSYILSPALFTVLLAAAYYFKKLSTWLKMDTYQSNLQMAGIILFLCTAIVFTIGGVHSGDIMLVLSLALGALVLFALLVKPKAMEPAPRRDQFFYYFTYCVNMSFPLFDYWNPAS